MRRKKVPRAVERANHRPLRQRLVAWTRNQSSGAALVFVGVIVILSITLLFYLRFGPEKLPSVLVAAPVDYFSVPGFLIAARSFLERAAYPSQVQLAVCADDLAWTELQGSCECYLPRPACGAMIRVPQAAGSGNWRNPRTRSAAMKSVARWEDLQQARIDIQLLLSLASCEGVGGPLASPTAVLVLPDPHVLATADLARLVRQLDGSGDSLRSSATVLSGGAPQGGGSALQGGGPFLVHGGRWRATRGLKDLPWSKCPLVRKGTAQPEATAPGPADGGGGERLRLDRPLLQVLANAGAHIGVLHGVGTWQGEEDLSVPPVGCRGLDRTARVQEQPPLPVLLRLAGQVKPWERRGDQEPGNYSVPQDASGDDASQCNASGGKGWLSVRHEMRRLLECRYPMHPGMPSVDYERNQYVHYYRFFRRWFQPGPVRPNRSEGKESLRDPRAPVNPTGLRFTDMINRMGKFEGQRNYAVFADKISVKHYARTVLGGGYTIDTLGVVLPGTVPAFRPPVPGLSDYALKAASVAGTNAILKDGKMVFCESAFLSLSRKLGMGGCKGKLLDGPLFDAVAAWVHRVTHRRGRERQYEEMRKALIIEQLYDGDTIPADYKFFCSRGSVMMVKEVAGRYSTDGSKRRGYYLPDWTWLPEVFQLALLKPAKEPGPPPAQLQEMVRVAQELSEPFPFVRVDLFQVGGRVYVGEMTFTPTAAEKRIEPPLIETTMGRIVGHHLPQPTEDDGWDSGFLGVPHGQVLTQEQVTEAMRPLTVKSAGGGNFQQYLDWKKKQDAIKNQHRSKE